MESAAEAFLRAQDVHFWTRSSDIPTMMPIQFNTQILDDFIPGFVKLYGRDKKVDVEYKLDSVGNFTIKKYPGDVGFDGSLSIRIWVETGPD